MFLINRFIGLPYVDGAHWYINVLLSVLLIVMLFRCINIQDNPTPYFLWLVLELIIDKTHATGDMYPIGGPFLGCVCIGIAIKNIQVLALSRKKYWYWIAICFFSTTCTFLSRGTIPTLELLVVAPIVWLCGLEKAKILENCVLVFLGTVSYPLYLIHQNISFVIQNVLFEVTGSYTMYWGIIALIIVFLIGIGLYYTIEKPIQNIIERLKRGNIQGAGTVNNDIPETRRR